jgi:hypothetical protein
MLRPLLLSCLLCTAACVANIGEGDFDPEHLDQRIFNQEALDRIAPGDQAYVRGHATGVFLFGKTLPTYVGHTRYYYRPGVSSQRARAAYNWAAVIEAPSGGVDGNGGLVPLDGDDVEPGDNGNEECDNGGDDVPGNCDGGDGGGGDGGGGDGGGGDGGGGDGGGDGGGGDGGSGDPDDPFIDDDCEDFLNPGADDARVLAAQVDAEAMFPSEASPSEIDAFHQGLKEALAVQDYGEDFRYSEPNALKDDVKDYGMCRVSPLVLDLNGDGIFVSNVAGGVHFDLKGSGTPLRTSWPVGGDDALLAFDRNGDGRITNGTELFGNARASNGFVALAALDTPAAGGDGNGYVDEQDRLFDQLLLWTDLNRDGISQDDELASLESRGITAIALDHVSTGHLDQNGNHFAQLSQFVVNDSEQRTLGSVVDVWFRVAKR